MTRKKRRKMGRFAAELAWQYMPEPLPPRWIFSDDPEASARWDELMAESLATRAKDDGRPLFDPDRHPLANGGTFSNLLPKP
jgi:hypothetical protein